MPANTRKRRNTTEPLVSVVVPVYNAEKHLAECLRSLVRQTLEPIEVILVNDCSTDQSLRICRSYCKRHAHFELIDHRKNMGAGAARNNGIAAARGRYLSFVDSDDLAEPHMLEVFYRVAERHGADLVMCQYKIKHGDREDILGMFNSDQRVWQRLGGHCYTQGLRQSDRMQVLTTIAYPWNKLYHRKLFVENHIRFPDTVVHNDIPVHWKSLLCADKIVLTSEALYLHKKFTDHNQLTNIFDRKRFELFRSLAIVDHFFQDYPEHAVYYPAFIKFKIDLLFWALPRFKNHFRGEFQERLEENLAAIPLQHLMAYYRKFPVSLKRIYEVENAINNHWLRHFRRNWKEYLKQGARLLGKTLPAGDQRD